MAEGATFDRESEACCGPLRSALPTRRTYVAQYVDVYHVRNGKATEHWHLVVDPKADAEFFAG